jgi:hypothetical protein
MRKLSGCVFGRLTVSARVGSRGNKAFWDCSCSCGGSIQVTTERLVSGKTRSCGCLVRERNAGRKRPGTGLQLSETVSRFGQPLSATPRNVRQRERYRTDEIYRKKVTESSMRTHRSNLKARLIRGARWRAKRLGIPFNLTEADVSIPAICPILGLEIVMNNTKQDWNSPSLDRIIPGLGYVKGNVLCISFRANSIKGSATLEELRAVLAYLERENAALTVLRDSINATI